MAKDVLPDLAIVLTFLRSGQGWGQTRLGEASKVSPNLVNDYERGRKDLKRPRLEYLISFMGLPPETIDETLEQLAANRAAARMAEEGGMASSRRRIQGVAARASRMAGDFTRSLLSLLSLEGEALRAREEARRRWARLERWGAEERLALIEESPKFRTWALCELVAAKSIEAAPSSPAKALELAGQALRMAELCPVDEPLRQRTEGYAWFHVANARRVTSDLPGSGRALAKAIELWDAGAPGDPGFFDEAIVLALEANIRKAQRRFPVALKRIEQALVADRGNLRGKLLLTKAQILGALGDIEASTEVLREVIPHVDEIREPRTALGIHCELLFNLCLQGRAPEAAVLLPQAQALADQLAQEVDLVHLMFLRGKIAAGIGQPDSAEEAFERARSRFSSFNPPLILDYALVSLELGLLLIEQGRASEAETLAHQMMALLTSKGIPVEALAALQVFCEAARRRAATADLTRRVILFLRRSQHDPGLKFEDTGEVEAP